jgi:hypothetical protein
MQAGGTSGTCGTSGNAVIVHIPNFKDTWPMYIVKEGLAVPTLLYEIKEQLPWYVTMGMSKDDRNNMVDVHEIFVCDPEPPHHKLPASTWIRPGDHILLRRHRVKYEGAPIQFFSKAKEMAGPPGADVPAFQDRCRTSATTSERPGYLTTLFAPLHMPVTEVYVEWTSVKHRSWLGFRFSESPPIRAGLGRNTHFEEVRELEGPAVEWLAVLHAEDMTRTLFAKYGATFGVLRIHIPSTLAVNMHDARSVKDVRVYFRDSRHRDPLRRAVVAFARSCLAKDNVLSSSTTTTHPT